MSTIVIVSSSKPIAFQMQTRIAKLIGFLNRFVIITNEKDLRDYLGLHKIDILFIESNCRYQITAHFVAKIAEKYPKIHIAVFSYEHFTPGQSAAFLTMGAGSFINLRDIDETIQKSLGIILGGNTYIPKEIEIAELKFFLDSPLKAKFTFQELNAFRLYAPGNSINQTAEKMNIKRGTSKNYKEKINKKLGIHNRSEYLVHALRIGIIGFD